MPDRTEPARLPLAAPPPRPPVRRRSAGGFAALWRIFLPGSIALILVAILDGIGNPDGRPVWLFAAGIGFALIGGTSFLRHLWDVGRAARYDRDPPSSRGPGR
jgi:hypothetical protein